jgi:hypothetical protein
MFTPNETVNFRQSTHHRQEMMHRAERARLVREALTGERGTVRLHKPLLALLGEKMVNWGTALQERYPSIGYSDDPMSYLPEYR